MVVWLPRAEKDLDTIYRTTAEENPTAALDLLTRIDEAVRRLEAFPNLGRPGRVSGTRELIVDGTSFIIPYRVRGGVCRFFAPCMVLVSGHGGSKVSIQLYSSQQSGKRGGLQDSLKS